MEENNNIRFPFSNKVVFSMVMQDAEKCRKLLERIFPHRKIRKVKVAEKDVAWKTIRGTEGVRSEMQILNDPYHKSIQLDVLFEDDENWYDIEMQVENADNIPKRSRYYHRMIDSVILSKGARYSELRPCYVIFICCFDLF